MNPSENHSRDPSRKFRLSPVAAALFGATVIGAPLGAVGAITLAPQDRSETMKTAAAPAVPMVLPDISSLVEAYGPAVINISVKGTTKVAGPAQFPGFPGFGGSDPFAPFRGGPGPQGPQEMPVQGQGSGFIVSKDGVILTNAHVVAEADEVTVKLTDRREYTAKVLGLDPTTDVAVLKIEASNLPVVRLGNPADVKVGEWVVAIGAPFGFENTVTQGIVSAKGRTLPDGGYVPFLQTDVAVNPGNSGGPLFNLRGEVVGINSQIYSRSGGYQGVSFAIPIDLAMNVSGQLQKTGHVSRGKLGVTIQGINQALAESFDLPRTEGALVSQIEDGSPADRAGLESGDVILALDGEPVTVADELPARIATMKPGSTVKLSVWRDKSQREIKVKLGEMALPQTASAQGAEPGGELGLAVRPLTSEEQRQAETFGLLIEQVGGAARDAGLRAGDIVISANGRAVRSVDELRGIVGKAGEHVALLVQRGEARLFVPVHLG